jgi:hypothetical protein
MTHVVTVLERRCPGFPALSEIRFGFGKQAASREAHSPLLAVCCVAAVTLRIFLCVNLHSQRT